MDLPSIGNLYSSAMQQLQGYGNAQKQELYQSYRNALGTGMQSLASAGLAGTTVAPSMRMGYMRQYQMALNNLSDTLSKSRLGVMSTFGIGGLQLQQGEQQLALDRERMAQQAEQFNRQQGLAENQQLYDWQRNMYAQQLAQKQYNLAAQQQAWNQRMYEQSRSDAQGYLSLV